MPSRTADFDASRRGIARLLSRAERKATIDLICETRRLNRGRYCATRRIIRITFPQIHQLLRSIFALHCNSFINEIREAPYIVYRKIGQTARSRLPRQFTWPPQHAKDIASGSTHRARCRAGSGTRNRERGSTKTPRNSASAALWRAPQIAATPILNLSCDSEIRVSGRVPTFGAKVVRRRPAFRTSTSPGARDRHSIWPV